MDAWKPLGNGALKEEVDVLIRPKGMSGMSGVTGPKAPWGVVAGTRQGAYCEQALDRR